MRRISEVRKPAREKQTHALAHVCFPFSSLRILTRAIERRAILLREETANIFYRTRVRSTFHICFNERSLAGELASLRGELSFFPRVLQLAVFLPFFRRVSFRHRQHAREGRARLLHTSGNEFVRLGRELPVLRADWNSLKSSLGFSRNTSRVSSDVSDRFATRPNIYSLANQVV